MVVRAEGLPDRLFRLGDVKRPSVLDVARW